MEIRIKSRNADIKPAIKEYAAEKVGRLEKYLEDQILSTDVELIEEKNPSIAANQTVEVTLSTKGHLIRAKETSVDMHASIDIVVEKLERQIKKYKDKMYSSALARKGEPQRPAATAADLESEIVRVKQVQVKPMTPEEATLQMDLLGHDFFVFKNADTEEINVVYRRNDDNYGLIEPTG